MPQIMCPNCGTTINLENRRKIDFGIIKEATEKSPKTFTELLHLTKLSRKTLNLRLKELCMEGVLVKEEGCYRLNGSSHVGGNGEGFMKGLSGVFNNKKIRTGIMLLALLAFSSASGYVLAARFPPPKAEPQSPKFLGTLTMNLNIVEVNDLYAWEAVISFDSSKLEVREVLQGDFFAAEPPFFVTAGDVYENTQLIGATKFGATQGNSGSGTLAIIVFGILAGDYELPTLLESHPKTMLLDSNRSVIPIGVQTLLVLQSAS